VPYRFGCFSFSSYADKRRLVEQGLLVDDAQQWLLTDAGREVARKRAVMPLLAGRFSRELGGLRGDALVTEVYRRHPYYATRSEIVDQVLKNPADRARVELAKPKAAAAGLLTIGYEGKCLETYLNQLLLSIVTMSAPPCFHSLSV
jgi:phage terminase Nu1 subunit (DNA packaging protein)